MGFFAGHLYPAGCRFSKTTIKMSEWEVYFMGLNLSNEQIAAELDLSVNEVQAMTTQLRQGIVVKKSLLS